MVPTFDKLMQPWDVWTFQTLSLHVLRSFLFGPSSVFIMYKLVTMDDMMRRPCLEYGDHDAVASTRR